MLAVLCSAAAAAAYLVTPLPTRCVAAASARSACPLATVADDAAEEYIGAKFDAALSSVIADARSSSFDTAVDTWLDRLDENFIPSLGERLEAPLEADNVEELQALMDSLTSRTADGFDRAKQQLEKLLDAGEINALDRQLVGMMNRDELDGGFMYVLFKNIEEAQSSGDDTAMRLLTHLHTRVQEEMEKKAEPGCAQPRLEWALRP